MITILPETTYAAKQPILRVEPGHVPQYIHDGDVFICREGRTGTLLRTVDGFPAGTEVVRYTVEDRTGEGRAYLLPNGCMYAD